MSNGPIGSSPLALSEGGGIVAAVAVEQPPVNAPAFFGSKLNWSFSAQYPITAFVVTKSVDGGGTFSALATVPFMPSDVTVYDRGAKRFVFDDAALAAGAIYRIVAVGLLGTSQARFVVVPPARPICGIFGYVYDAVGRPGKANITVSAYAPAGSGPWTQLVGARGHRPQAAGVIEQTFSVSPDASTGVWQVTLLQGIYARIVCAELGLDQAVSVPMREGPINHRDIPYLRQADAGGLWGDTNSTRARVLFG